MPLFGKILSFVLLFVTLPIFSQEKKDLTFEKSIMFSLKPGYHTEFRSSYDNGFPGGFVFDASFSYGLNKFMTIGVNIEFWNKKNVRSTDPLGTTNSNDISAIGFGGNIQLRKSVFNILNFYFGAGLGNYSFKRTTLSSGFNSSTEKNYLSLFALFGTDIMLHKNIFLTGECVLYLCLGLDFGGPPPPKFMNIKVGPTFFFKLPK